MPKILQILLLGSFLLCGSATGGTPPVELKPGMVISSSVTIRSGTYHLNGTDSLGRYVILIQGDNITVDFNKAILQGSNDKQWPNEFYGLAVLIKGNNIRIRNAVVNGYKVALMATGCKNLKIENCNLSYNYRQHLQSSWLHEDLSDWMSYHHNENDEWLRYGAGIYLKDCEKATINDNTITGGQCGLMMTSCNDGMIYGNDFSFNSALGIGMYRSSRNSILNNKLDFNVRGYSHGFYNRGQDSAGILVFEQCNENVFAYNSATHSGDGFFLWAGQTTMDSGKGGCNYNYIYKNDFSFAPTNGVEVTFSKNNIRNNIIKECDNGIWGGYSWETSIVGNKLYKNRTGIAIEHGQNNSISSNEFKENKLDAIKLWARKIQPSDWGYANKRDTRSQRYNLLYNKFEKENNAINVVLTDHVIITGNTYSECKKNLKLDSTVTNLVMDPMDLTDTTALIPGIISKWKKTTIPVAAIAGGREQMRITEWGPYDYRYPIIFLKNIDSNGIYHFDVLGPKKASINIVNSKDANIIVAAGSQFPTELEAKRTGPDMQINLEYSGVAFADQFGKPQPANKPYAFSFRDFQPVIDWNVNWYSWDAAHDPNKNYDLFKTVFNNSPVKTEQAKKIDYTWWGKIGDHLPADSFATVAVGTVDVPKGLYNLGVTADDLVKVFIDGKLVIDFWDASKYKNDEDAYHSAKVKLDGKHTIRIEQVENGGYATLIFYLKPIDK